jgi:predicted permease
MATLFTDIRYAIRSLLKRPGFSAIIVITLALGIGANTAIFTVTNAVMLRALPVSDPQQLVILSDPDSQGWRKGWETENRTLFSYHEFEWLRDHNQVFSGIFASNSNLLPLEVADVNASPSGDAPPARVSLVSGAYFSVLGVSAIRGRTFTDDVDKARDANSVAVISYDYWKNHFALNPVALSTRIRIRQTTFDIIGITPEGFSGETVGHAPDIWIPLTMQMEVIPAWGDSLSPPKVRSEGQVMWLQIMARLKPGVTAPQARARINLAFQQLLQAEAGEVSADARRDYFNQSIALVEGSRGASTLHESFGQPLLMLMALVGLVLLIACANVANLLLARATARQKEIALRVTLGATRRRLVRQLLTESVALALLGGALGLLFAQWADAVLLRLVSSGALPMPLDLHPDARILLFTLAISLLAGILFGLAPAIRATRLDLNAALRGSATGTMASNAPSGRLPAAKILVVGQVALSFTLLIAAGLLMRSFQKLTHLNPGYDRDHLLLVSIYPEPSDFKGAALTQLDRRLLERLRAVPGVTGATLSSRGLFNWGEVDMTVWLDGDAPPPGQQRSATFDFVGPRYFSTLGMPMLAGRDIGPEDEGNTQRAGVINQTMARAFFGDANPIGRHLHADRDHPFEIVVIGIAADGKYNNLREQTPSQCYLPYFHSQSAAPHATFELRVADAMSVAAAIRGAVKEIGPALRSPEIRMMSEVVDQSLTTERMLTQLSSFFGLLALLLACIGLYGVMSYNVAGRTNEIGIRMALGAQPRTVFKLIAGQGMTLVLIGILIGLAAALALTRLISSLLFGVSPTDSITFVAVAVLLAGVALLACYIPARRATKVNPLVALRYE